MCMWCVYSENKTFQEKDLAAVRKSCEAGIKIFK